MGETKFYYNIIETASSKFAAANTCDKVIYELAESLHAGTLARSASEKRNATWAPGGLDCRHRHLRFLAAKLGTASSAAPAWRMLLPSGQLRN